jgi:hypothetical protein
MVATAHRDKSFGTNSIRVIRGTLMKKKTKCLQASGMGIQKRHLLNEEGE